MKSSMLGEIRRIQRLSVTELQAEWPRLYNGEPCRSRNRSYLVKRLCWRLQEIRLGGLSDRARARIAELAPDSFVRAVTPLTLASVEAVPFESSPEPAPVRTVRDPRLPTAGTVLTRQYRGREIRVLTLEDGFEWEGRRYGSLSEVARAVTGQHWSGPLFFGLRTRTRRK